MSANNRVLFDNCVFTVSRCISDLKSKLHNMEASNLASHSKNIAQNKLPVIRVVNLKRFMPGTEVKPDMKRKKYECGSKLNCNTNPMKIHYSTNFQTEPIINCAHEPSGNQIAYTIQESSMKQNETSNNLCDDSYSELNKLADISRSKLIFRNCSHTQEELSKLTEHSDESLVKVGDVFDSRESFRQYINDKARIWFYYYVCRNSKIKILEYNCICMAYSAKPREVIIRRQKKRTTACPCKIRLSVDLSTNNVSVYYVCNHHDHDLTEAAFYQYPHAKYLPQHVKDEFLDLAYLGLDAVLIQKYIYSLIGLIIKRKDIWSYAYKFKRKIFQRSLPADRKKYMKDLISKIRDAFDETVVIGTNSVEQCAKSSVNKSCKPEQTNKRKPLRNAKKRQNALIHNTTVDDPGISLNDEDMKLFTSSCINADVIVQYINEKGILCDRDGTPVTNSSAIVQFVNTYEHSMHDGGVEEQFLEEGTVFSELGMDWDSIQDINAVIKNTSVDSDEPYVDDEAENLILCNDDIAGELSVVTTECQQSLEQDDTVTVLSDAVEKFDVGRSRLSPTVQSPAVYAEMELFQKYYFVDHRYIKYEGDNSRRLSDGESKGKKPAGRGRTIPIGRSCEEYIKAPDVIYCPTPLKLCSGHEGLTLLTDPDAILPGAKFVTLDVFLSYVNERATRWYFYYSLMESGKSPEYYVYKCHFGKNRTSRNAYRARGLRKRPTFATQCPCQIRLRRLESDPAYLTVLYSCNHHDHPLDARLFKEQPHSRRLPENMKEEVKDLLSLGATFDILRKYVMSETGLRIYGKYFHNVKVKMRKNNENRQFTAERLVVLTQKIKDLEARNGNATKGNSRYRRSKARRLSNSQRCDGPSDAGSGAGDVYRVGCGRYELVDPSRQGHRAKSTTTRKEKDA